LPKRSVRAMTHALPSPPSMESFGVHSSRHKSCRARLC
jgi:hypothetical protein